MKTVQGTPDTGSMYCRANAVNRDESQEMLMIRKLGPTSHPRTVVENQCWHAAQLHITFEQFSILENTSSYKYPT